MFAVYSHVLLNECIKFWIRDALLVFMYDKCHLGDVPDYDMEPVYLPLSVIQCTLLTKVLMYIN